MKRAILLAVSLSLGACGHVPEFGPRPVELRGKIGPQMTEQVQAALAAGHRDFTINSSHGGYVLSAAFMANMMNAHEARLTANGACYSACALLLVGVRDHHVAAGADVQSHASTIEATGQQTTHAADWLEKHGLPRNLAEGPNLRRIDGSTSPPPPIWGNRDPFHF